MQSQNFCSYITKLIDFGTFQFIIPYIKSIYYIEGMLSVEKRLFALNRYCILLKLLVYSLFTLNWKHLIKGLLRNGS